MKFLVIVQDLRVSGTSAGIVVRSFLSKLKNVYSNSSVDVLYIAHFESSNNNEAFNNLPVNTVSRKVISNNIPFHIKWINRFTTRFLNILYAENYIHKKYAKYIKKINYESYDHIFITSSGIKHETILATHNLPILKKAIILFHDPYPHSWYDTKPSKIHKNEYLRLKKMISVVRQAKTCCATAYYMAKDLQYLYASNKNFYTLPHQFDSEAFNLDIKNKIRKKGREIQISYHGALMLGRNIFNVLDAYKLIIEQNDKFKNHTEFILRVKGDGIDKLKQEYGKNRNVKIMELLDFSNSAYEQMYESDINIILENGPYYCNILPGKVPFLAATGKPILVMSPERSELRRIIKNHPKYIADMNDIQEIRFKLENLILDLMDKKEIESPFDDYFSDKNFKKSLDNIIRLD